MIDFLELSRGVFGPDLTKAEERLLAKWNNWPKVEHALAYSVAEVLRRDLVLLKDETGELCIAHRLAVYLEQKFRGWHVDFEFNRMGAEGERIPKQVRATNELKESRKGTDKAKITPDIIVHRRRTGFNLIALEVKPSDRCEKAIERDRNKLRKYLMDSSLRYSFAALLVYEKGGETFKPIERVTVDGEVC